MFRYFFGIFFVVGFFGFFVVFLDFFKTFLDLWRVLNGLDSFIIFFAFFKENCVWLLRLILNVTKVTIDYKK